MRDFRARSDPARQLQAEFQLRQLDQPGGVVEKTAQLSANEGLTKCQFQLRHVLLEPTPFLA
jgi:hypothetical protein